VRSEPACGCALAAACWLPSWLCCGRCTSEVPPSLGLCCVRCLWSHRRFPFDVFFIYLELKAGFINPGFLRPASAMALPIQQPREWRCGCDRQSAAIRGCTGIAIVDMPLALCGVIRDISPAPSQRSGPIKPRGSPGSPIGQCRA
jgi:hypothetical protein